jgi:hypothetical protein
MAWTFEPMHFGDSLTAQGCEIVEIPNDHV